MGLFVVLRKRAEGDGVVYGPGLSVDRIFERTHKDKPALQLSLKNVGSTLTFREVKEKPGNKLKVELLPPSDPPQKDANQYPQGTSLTLFLSGEDLMTTPYNFYVVYSDSYGMRYEQEIKGKGIEIGNLPKPQLASIESLPAKKRQNASVVKTKPEAQNPKKQDTPNTQSKRPDSATKTANQTKPVSSPRSDSSSSKS